MCLIFFCYETSKVQYFYDVGLASYLLGMESIKHVEIHPLRGNLFENLVLIDLLKYRYNLGLRNNLNFYRDSRGNEIDIIYRRGAHVFPIEVKSAETVSPDFFKGFIAFEKIVSELPFGKAVIYAGDREETRGDITIAPAFKIREILKEVD